MLRWFWQSRELSQLRAALTSGSLEARRIRTHHSSNGVSSKEESDHRPLSTLTMASILMRSLLVAFLLAHTTLSLQVSSTSPCSSVCLAPGQDASGPNVINTAGSDVICIDDNYATTPTGQRFMACVSCLQTSTASDENGSDQEWFICRFSCKPRSIISNVVDQIIYVLLWIRACSDSNSQETLSPHHVLSMEHANRFRSRSETVT